MTRLAPWAADVGTTIAASIYALAVEDRLRGALSANEAGYWVHADVILGAGDGGDLVNSGVALAEITKVLDEVPGVKLDVHLMVLPGTPGWEEAVELVARVLADASVTRWTATNDVLERLVPGLPAGSETWVEFWPERDGPLPEPGHDGVLTMLIEPGTKGNANPATIELLASMRRSHVPIGVDGGVTKSVASAVVAAGAAYVVVGRALFVTP